MRVKAKDAWMLNVPGAIPRVSKKSKSKKTGLKEKTIQAQVEGYLQVKGIRYFRMPDELYRLIFANMHVDLGSRKRIAEYIKGVPDLMIFKKEGDYNSVLFLEIKAEYGKVTQGQKHWHQGLNVEVKKSFEECKIVIDKFAE